ncbi:MAG: DUF2029 domain-containing protein [Sphingomonadales bacterium]|nr:DUF2029 domain-containing protein [Sphingomonadales bacterium]MDE2169586.1 DUF2029 domain-containing protein [Sphingomonadales bacterium]
MTGKGGWLGALQLRWLGIERVSAYGYILAFGGALSLIWAYAQATGTGGSDFLAFWSAGRLVAQGHASQVYDLSAVYHVQAALSPISREHTAAGEAFAFVNPPPFLLVVAPLGWLDYRVALVVWVLATYALWFWVARRWAPELAGPIWGFPGAIVAAWHAQTGLLLSAVQIAMANLLRDRPAWAGVMVGLLVVKPHLALLVPVAFVAGRHWRAFWAAGLTVPLFVLLAWLVFGTQTLVNYSHSWPVSQGLMDYSGPEFFLRQTTVYAALRVALSARIGMAVQLAVSLAMVILVWKAWRGSAALEGKLALLMAAVPLATPYMFSYDQPFLILPVCWLARQARVSPRSGWDRVMVLAFYTAPLATRALALPMHMNLMPWVSMALVWAVWRRLHHPVPEGSARAAGGAPAEGHVHPF